MTCLANTCVSAVSFCLSPFNAHALALALSPRTHTQHKQTHLHYLSHTPAHNPVNTPSCPAPSPSNLVSLSLTKYRVYCPSVYNGPVWSLWFSGLNVACSPALGCECYRRAAAYGPHTIPTPRRTALGDKTGTIDRKCILFHGFPQASPFPGPYQRTNAFEKQGKQSTGRHCCPHFDRSNQAFPSAYIWSLSGPHPAARGVEIQMLSHLYVLRGVYSGQIYRTSASGLSFCLTHSCLVPYGPYLF